MLSFWCWYNIETNYDFGVVEVSKDGRFFTVLDTFTGQSSNWVQKQYNLSTYAGDSIYIRFRYTTDQSTLNEGFYVDDITPVPTFNSTTTLSSSIPQNSYQITGKTAGIYYYRVRGHNPFRGWGDFSTLKKVQVPTNSPPNIPSQPTGPIEGIKGTSYIYTTSTTDSNGDNVYYMWDWGDGNISGWLGPYTSGQTASATYTWSTRGTYQVKVKAKDIYGAESGWSTPLTVNIYKLGDVNNDGWVTFADIDPFVAAIGTTETDFQTQHPTWSWLAADCNQDGRVTFADIDPFVATIGS